METSGVSGGSGGSRWHRRHRRLWRDRRLRRQRRERWNLRERLAPAAMDRTAARGAGRPLTARVVSRSALASAREHSSATLPHPVAPRPPLDGSFGAPAELVRVPAQLLCRALQPDRPGSESLSRPTMRRRAASRDWDRPTPRGRGLRRLSANRAGDDPDHRDDQTTATTPASQPGPRPACDGAPSSRRTRCSSEPPVAATASRPAAPRSCSRFASACA